MKKLMAGQYWGYSSPPLAAGHPEHFFGEKEVTLPLFLHP